MKYLFPTTIAFVLAPTLVYAKDADDIIQILLRIVEKLIPILVGLAVLLFLWGLFRYLTSSDEKTRGDAVVIITYGVIILFVMVSVWGLVNLLANTFDLNIEQNIPLDHVFYEDYFSWFRN